jgi:hypothetical protein
MWWANSASYLPPSRVIIERELGDAEKLGDPVAALVMRKAPYR